MTLGHSFGGDWTEKKLEILKKYLEAYTKIFRTNSMAQYLRPTFIDAFAGTGYRTVQEDVEAMNSLKLFTNEDLEGVDAVSFRQGSSQIALELQYPFHRYIFIEKDPARVKELDLLKTQYPELASRITIQNGDSNRELLNWTNYVRKRNDRAVVFLDPYGMEVEWNTIQKIAETQSIDLWVLVPVGQAINRLLLKNELPPKSWADRLTTFFGTDEWVQEFYRPRPQMTLDLFEDNSDSLGMEKTASIEKIGDFFLKRLKKVFPKVVHKPLYLKNSRNVIIYILCFASFNQAGLNIAEDLINRVNKK